MASCQPPTFADRGTIGTHPYRLRQSARAKHISIKISPYGEIEVVTPRQFDPQKLPAILRQKQAWIEQTLARLAHQRQAIAPDLTSAQPGQIDLRALDESWELVYLLNSRDRLQVTPLNSRQLAVVGPSDNLKLCQAGLQKWLKRKASLVLPNWLSQISQRAQLPYQRVSVRGQKSRWGSCSSQQNISLNYKLLFLPPPLVTYVLVHELCHTLQMNHSAAFWRLVEQHLPDYAIHRQQLKQAWQYIPQWLEQQM
ncbi:M48 family metallopeptidase [Almyronema epifaneia]|uniref:M48 family metallopeptidase n=1 Tax=Almyronema epifaneia S1 TaxID=2991925 RepID=A0ABW6IGG5_9CYAN